MCCVLPGVENRSSALLLIPQQPKKPPPDITSPPSTSSSSSASSLVHAAYVLVGVGAAPRKNTHTHTHATHFVLNSLFVCATAACHASLFFRPPKLALIKIYGGSRLLCESARARLLVMPNRRRMMKLFMKVWSRSTSDGVR